MYAFLYGFSFGEVLLGIGALALMVGGVAFWGTGLGWKDGPKDPRNGL